MDPDAAPLSTNGPLAVNVPVYQASAFNRTQTTSKSPESSSKSPTSPPHAAVNTRSCITCRKRKVKCDKRHPCANCGKAGIDCIFPGPGRAPRRNRKPPDTELLARLRRLEGVVQSLGKGSNGEDLPPETGMKEEDSRSSPESNDAKAEVTSPDVDGHQRNGSIPTLPQKSGIEHELGRLVVDEGRSRYVSNTFWTSMSQEVAEIRDVLDDPSEEENDYPSPEVGGGSSIASADHNGFIFGFRSTMLTLRGLHPQKHMIGKYWDIFKETVDPVIKVFHKPTVERMLKSAAQDLDRISKKDEALLFAIYLGVVTALGPEECETILFEKKDAALSKYRFATEQALARADFLNSQELIMLQAMTIFLVCIRRNDDSRFVWALTGLLVRLAQSLGLHRDAEQFSITPFETEMRRRLWWQICVLDVRASEDHGTDPSITEALYDTKFPLNINDDDIDQETKHPPPERIGCTELTFCLIRYEVGVTIRRINYIPPGNKDSGQRNIWNASIEQREGMIEELRQRLEEKYLRHCDPNVALQWVTATVARLILAKMWLVIHHPLRRSDRGAGLSQDIKDKLFATSIEVVEFSYTLEYQTASHQWGWLFRTYVQWHAVAYLLSELAIRTKGPKVEEAWAAIENVFEEWGGRISSAKKGMLWRPMRKLMAKARAARARELEKSARFPLDGSIGPAVAAPLDTSMLAHPSDLQYNVSNDIPNPFVNFDPSMMPVADTMGMGAVPAFDNSLSTFDQPQFTSEEMNTLMANDSPYSHRGVFSVDETTNWSNWDNMVKDLEMGDAQAQGPDRGIFWSEW